MPHNLKRPTLQVLTLDRIGRTHAEQAEAACLGGAKWIQLRAKRLHLTDWIALAKQVVEVCRRHEARCIVNDSVWVALAAGADGVHLGKKDLSPCEARGLMGADKIIGVTVNSPEDADRVIREKIADYAGVGPWRFTKSKSNLSPVLPPATIRHIIEKLSPLPCVVIGGVTRDDIRPIIDLGAHGLAVSSAIVGAENPADATRDFLSGITTCAG